MSFYNYRTRSVKALENEGFRRLAGPYSQKEEDMLDRLLADAKRAGKEVSFSGDHSKLEVWHR